MNYGILAWYDDDTRAEGQIVADGFTNGDAAHAHAESGALCWEGLTYCVVRILEDETFDFEE